MIFRTIVSLIFFLISAFYCYTDNLMKENDDSTDDEIDDNNDDKVSISSTFYAHIFCQYFGSKNYKAETFGFETFWQKDIGKRILAKDLRIKR
jgi:hypothetical protein